jgi:hypothetical protein
LFQKIYIPSTPPDRWTKTPPTNRRTSAPSEILCTSSPAVA